MPLDNDDITAIVYVCLTYKPEKISGNGEYDIYFQNIGNVKVAQNHLIESLNRIFSQSEKFLMGKISKLLVNAVAIASVQAQDFEVTDCSNDNVSTR